MPRARAPKKTEEEKEAEFTEWQTNSPEAKAMEELYVEIMIVKVDNGSVDILNTAAMDYQKFLTALHKCVAVLKVPGRKAKQYENPKVRTMFFENAVKMSIDGVVYEISLSSKTDMFNNRMSLYEIKQHFENSYNDRDANNYIQFKKDLVKLLKVFEKGYTKHTKKKGNHDFMDQEVHQKAMMPLTLLCDKNNNFHQLEVMIEQGIDVPEFRYIALENEFSTHLTNVLEILKTYGDLTYHFNIPQMLKTMKIPKWR